MNTYEQVEAQHHDLARYVAQQLSVHPLYVHVDWFEGGYLEGWRDPVTVTVDLPNYSERFGVCDLGSDASIRQQARFIATQIQENI